MAARLSGKAQPSVNNGAMFEPSSSLSHVIESPAARPSKQQSVVAASSLGSRYSARRPSTKLSLCVQYAVPGEGLPTRQQFRRWVKAALERDAKLTLRIVDETEGRQLNGDYRRKDYATNVLTFAYGESEPHEQTSTPREQTSIQGKQMAAQALLGDIVLCAPVVAREAAAQGKAMPHHYAHLTVHGVLHMQGFDHEESGEATAMEAREVAILARLGVANPYCED